MIESQAEDTKRARNLILGVVALVTSLVVLACVLVALATGRDETYIANGYTQEQVCTTHGTIWTLPE